MKILGKILAVISSIFFFFILTALLTATFMLNFVSPKYYSNIIKSVDFKSMKVSELGELFSQDSLNSVGLEEDATLEDVLVTYFTKGDVSEELAVAIVNNETIREVVGSFIGEYVSYTLGGEKPSISRDDVEKVFNEPDVKKLLNSSSEEMNLGVDKIYEQLNNLVDEMVKGGENPNDNNSERNNKVVEPY